MSNTPKGLRAYDTLTSPAALLLVAAIEAAQEAPPHERVRLLVALGEFMGSSQVIDNLRWAMRARRGELVGTPLESALASGSETAEAVLRAVVELQGAMRLYAHDSDAAFQIMDAFSANADALEEVGEGLLLAPPEAWNHVVEAGLRPELGGEWWCAAYSARRA